jgi:hypothetical protein
MSKRTGGEKGKKSILKKVIQKIEQAIEEKGKENRVHIAKLKKKFSDQSYAQNASNDSDNFLNGMRQVLSIVMDEAGMLQRCK